jgi:hypothetical protein
VNTVTKPTETERYARCIAASKSVRWDLEEDVIRGRRFTTAEKYLPDGLSLVEDFAGLSDGEKRFVSQIQGRTYANIFGLVERYINAKILELGREHALGDQIKLEALLRFSDEELKHQAMFRRIDAMMNDVMPAGYAQAADPDAVASAVLSKSTWAVLALTLDIELFTQAHYRKSIDADPKLSELYKDVFLFHWKEESQHAILDELEWRRHDATLAPEARDAAVDDLIQLVAAVDGILQAQAALDASYFAANCGRTVTAEEKATIEAGFLKAYRWQYIFSGVQHPHFQAVLGSMISPVQAERIGVALATFNA